MPPQINASTGFLVAINKEAALSPLTKEDEGAEKVFLLSTGAEYGNHYSTEQMLEVLIRQCEVEGDDTFDVDFATQVFSKCGFEEHSVALELQDVFRRFSRTEYLQHRATNLVGLAQGAAEQALKNWGGPREAITHFFWGTMTGAMHSPTIDIELTKRLGLSLDVQRTSIEGMGCLTGFRLLNLASQVAKHNPSARILVVAADLRSAIGNSLPAQPTRADIVSVALFRDAASATIVGSGPLWPQEEACYEVIQGLSRIVPETKHLVDYQEMDNGAIRLHLDRDHVAIAEPDFVATLLEVSRKESIGLDLQTNVDILCHMGGPCVLKEVVSALGVTKDKMMSSWKVMTAHGERPILRFWITITRLPTEIRHLQQRGRFACQWGLESASKEFSSGTVELTDAHTLDMGHHKPP